MLALDSEDILVWWSLDYQSSFFFALQGQANCRRLVDWLNNKQSDSLEDMAIWVSILEDVEFFDLRTLAS